MSLVPPGAWPLILSRSKASTDGMSVFCETSGSFVMSCAFKVRSRGRTRSTGTACDRLLSLAPCLPIRGCSIILHWKAAAWVCFPGYVFQVGIFKQWWLDLDEIFFTKYLGRGVSWFIDTLRIFMSLWRSNQHVQLLSIRIEPEERFESFFLFPRLFLNIH